MAIDGIHSSLLWHPIFNSSGEKVGLERSHVERHKHQTDQILPLHDEADHLSPSTPTQGIKVDILV
mgnify:FL=1